MFANMRVLFIDDDPSILRAVGRALDAEFEITQSPSIEDALGLIECGRRYDAILCDVDFGTGMQSSAGDDDIFIGAYAP